jgi:hypothetical protein
VSEVGGLAVAWSPVDIKEVTRALRRLDPDLFLDKEYEPMGPRGPYVYLVVKHWIGSGAPPVPVLEWRDAYGPKPITLGIVEEVRRKEGAMDGAFKKVIEANALKKQKTEEASGEAFEDIARGGFHSVRGTKSVVLPRSQALRQSRDRARAQGKKV